MLKEIVGKAAELIKLAESTAGKTGPEKRAVVVKGLCAVIDIPFVPEWAEGLFEPALYGFIVDSAVDWLNRLTGHALEDVPEDPEVAETVADLVKTELKAAAIGVEPVFDDKFDALLAKYGVKEG